MRLRHIVPALLLTVSTALAHADMTPVKDACALLTLPELAAVVGTPVKVGVTIPGMCLFSKTSGGSAITVSGNTYDNTSDAAEQIHSQIMVGRTLGKVPESVSGLGDSAIFLVSAAGDLTLQVAKGRNVLSISVLHAGIPDALTRKQALIQAAKQALPRF